MMNSMDDEQLRNILNEFDRILKDIQNLKTKIYSDIKENDRSDK